MDKIVSFEDGVFKLGRRIGLISKLKCSKFDHGTKIIFLCTSMDSVN